MLCADIRERETMTIEFHDPRAKPMVAAEPYNPRADLSGPLVVGLLANGFPDSEAFLAAMEVPLAESLPQARFKHYNKHNASIRVPEKLLEEITDECTVAIAAYGH
mgnify:CR=1 FL=1